MIARSQLAHQMATLHKLSLYLTVPSAHQWRNGFKHVHDEMSAAHRCRAQHGEQRGSGESELCLEVISKSCEEGEGRHQAGPVGWALARQHAVTQLPCAFQFLLRTLTLHLKMQKCNEGTLLVT